MERGMVFVCEQCNEKFLLGEGIDIVYDKQYNFEGKSIFLTYYDCPKCGKRHFVQIDDTRSHQMKNEVVKMFIKLSKKRMNDKDIPKTQNEKFKKLNKKLEDYRLNLKKEYHGRSVFNEDGSIEAIYFSNV